MRERVLLLVTYVRCGNIRRIWETKILDTLNKQSEKQGDYILLRGHQVRSPLCTLMAALRHLL